MDSVVGDKDYRPRAAGSLGREKTGCRTGVGTWKYEANNGWRDTKEIEKMVMMMYVVEHGIEFSF